jgi:hypothetical protein
MLLLLLYLEFNEYPTLTLRVAHVADWVERNVCALSASGADLSFCPDTPLVCPEDATLLGYPWVLLSSGASRVQGRGFDPARVTQWPPPETPLWRDTTTKVVITAYDAGENSRNCTWHVHVPPLVELGSTTVNVRTGSFRKSLRFSGSSDGLVYKLDAMLLTRLKGTGTQIRGIGTIVRGKEGKHRRLGYKRRAAGSSVELLLRDRNHKQSGGLIVIRENGLKAEAAIPGVQVNFSPANTSDASVALRVSQNRASNVLTITAYGQVKMY